MTIISKIRRPERAGTDSNTPRWVFPVLVAILIIAAVMRIWGIDYGLPYEGVTYDQVTFEESQEVLRAFKLGIGEYVWHFGKGGLYYILFVEYGFFYIISLALGWVSDSREFAINVLQDRTSVYVIGRLTNVLFGLMTYLVIYAIGKRLYDWRVGLVAAIIGASAYFHAVFSTVINVDIGMTFAFWASVLVYAKYEDDQKLRYLVAAGALGGVAIAFKLPAVILLPIVFLAIISAPGNLRTPRLAIAEGGTFLIALLVALTVIAPEWVFSIKGMISNNLFGIIGTASAQPAPSEELDAAIKTISVIRLGSWTGYLQQLTWDYNVALTIGAVSGIILGIARLHRWDIILSILVIGFVGGMSLSYRTQSEHYLIPIMPAMWLLGGRVVAAIFGRHRSLGMASLLAIIVVPLISLVRHDVEKLHPDTRIVAKQWIEANILPGSKFLMDGMQFRFIPSPPLAPDQLTIDRQVNRAIAKDGNIGRGVSQLTLDLYEEASSNVEGPTYELYSTMHGVGLEGPDFYISNCFNYVVTSSYITRRYSQGQPGRELFPKAAEFYDALSADARFREVYRIAPIPWNSVGPTITVYEVQSSCLGKTRVKKPDGK